jgi:Fur family iron response transcriptional regulator
MDNERTMSIDYNNNNPDRERLPTLLIQQGVRPTRQRLALASVLFDGNHKHVTAEQVVLALKKKRAKVSLATVYNNLHQFTKVGLLREIAVDNSCSYFDTNTTIHGHYFDEVTGHLFDIPDEALHMINLPVPPEGRKIKRVDITIRLSQAE